MNLEILKIASDTKNHKILDDQTHKSKKKNPLCGDEMEISVKISKNQILDFGYQCKSCIYCQASASLLAKFSINKSINNINKIITYSNTVFENKNPKIPREWKKFEILFNGKNLPRKDCILLPFKALYKAINS